MRQFGLGLRKTKDHVIGRKFPPSGMLDGQCNLLVKACEDCNQEKARLENDISAITLHQLAFAAISNDDVGMERLPFVAEVLRKGRAHSAITKRFVAESQITNNLCGKLATAEISITTVGPPQLDPDRVLRLAAMHIKGFAALVFLDPSTGNLNYLPSMFLLVEECGKNDWGNPRAMAFMEAVSSWPSRLLAPHAARGFFRAAIRKEPGPRPVWSWSLEWNRTLRTMGFMGDDEKYLKGLADELPGIPWGGEHVSVDPEGRRLVQRWRQEVPLRPEKDSLFGPLQVTAQPDLSLTAMGSPTG